MLRQFRPAVITTHTEFRTGAESVKIRRKSLVYKGLILQTVSKEEDCGVRTSGADRLDKGKSYCCESHYGQPCGRYRGDSPIRAHVGEEEGNHEERARDGYADRGIQKKSPAPGAQREGHAQKEQNEARQR